MPLVSKFGYISNVCSFFEPFFAQKKLKIPFYYVNTSEIPSELSCENFISSHVKISLSLWLHNKSRL